MAHAETWACFSGVEIVNGHRVFAYINNGLIPGFSLPSGNCLGQCADGCNDCCLCAALDVDTFVSPQDDGAPWVDPTRLDSRDFLGIYGAPELPSVLRRDLGEYARGGASVGPLRPRPRTIAFTGTMFAVNQRGMAYGERWLTEVLSGLRCPEDCAADELRLVTGCPFESPDPPPVEPLVALAYGEAFYGEYPYGGEDFTLTPDIATFPYYREALRVGIVDGPVFTPIDGTCQLQEVSFQLAAGVPYLFSASTTCLEETLSPGQQVCCRITAPEWPGDMATKITLTTDLQAANDTLGVNITATSTQPGSSCPDTGGAPNMSYEFGVINKARRIVIDSRTRTFTEEIMGTGQTISALPLLTNSFGPVDFIDVAPCAEICLCIDVDGSSLGSVDVKVEVFNREL